MRHPTATVINPPQPESPDADPADAVPSSFNARQIPRWLAAVVLLGAALTATGAIIALLPSGDHLNASGQSYAMYFVTRNLAVSIMLGATLALRSWRVLAGVMTLTALIQTLDAATAVATGHYGLVPIDLIYAFVFLIGAARLSGHPFWQAAAWRTTVTPRL